MKVMESLAARVRSEALGKVLLFPEREPHQEVPRDPAEWRAFYDAHWAWIYQVVRRLGGPHIDVEDAVQDVFVVLSSKLHTFEGRSQLRTWMYRICMNITSEHRRRRRRHQRIERAATALTFWDHRPSRDHRAVEAQSDVALAQSILSKMSEKKREVFILREVEQLSGEEVAEILEIPAATVRTRLFHARKEFNRLLEKVQKTEPRSGRSDP